MHTAENRDAMVSRINKAFAEHRTLESWPVTVKWDIQAQVAAPYGEGEYVKALYTLCAEGVPTGRLKDGVAIVGDRAGAEEAPRTGKVLKAGR